MLLEEDQLTLPVSINVCLKGAFVWRGKRCAQGRQVLIQEITYDHTLLHPVQGCCAEVRRLSAPEDEHICRPFPSGSDATCVAIPEADIYRRSDISTAVPLTGKLRGGG